MKDFFHTQVGLIEFSAPFVLDVSLTGSMEIFPEIHTDNSLITAKLFPVSMPILILLLEGVFFSIAM